MSEELRWSLSIQVVSGPTVAANGTIKPDAYNKIRVGIPAAATGTDGTETVTVNTTGAELLIIKASQYVDGTDENKILQYLINPIDPPPDPPPTEKNLSAPLVLIGADAVKLLADPVTTIAFTNPIEAEITVDIIVAGDATP